MRFPPRHRVETGGSNTDLFLHACIPERLAHQGLRHRATHDVAKANKKKRSHGRWNQALVSRSCANRIEQTEAGIDVARSWPEPLDDPPLLQNVVRDQSPQKSF